MPLTSTRATITLLPLKFKYLTLISSSPLSFPASVVNVKSPVGVVCPGGTQQVTLLFLIKKDGSVFISPW